MTPLTHLTSPTTPTSRQRARKRRSFDAVVASYIRELAATGATNPKPSAAPTPQGC